MVERKVNLPPGMMNPGALASITNNSDKYPICPTHKQICTIVCMDEACKTKDKGICHDCNKTSHHNTCKVKKDMHEGLRMLDTKWSTFMEKLGLFVKYTKDG